MASYSSIGSSRRARTPAALGSNYAELAASDRSSLARIMAMDFDTLLSGGYLPKVDIGSMAHSLETRAPFLARDVIAAYGSFAALPPVGSGSGVPAAPHRSPTADR